ARKCGPVSNPTPPHPPQSDRRGNPRIFNVKTRRLGTPMEIEGAHLTTPPTSPAPDRTKAAVDRLVLIVSTLWMRLRLRTSGRQASPQSRRRNSRLDG